MLATVRDRLRLALHQPRGIRRLVRNVALDLRFGGRPLGGIVETGNEHRGYHHSVNSDYDVFPYMFSKVELGADDVVVDVGCGKARLMNWLLSRRVRNRLIGVEVDPELASAARRRLRRYRNVEIICGDVLELLPADGTVFYMYNPFTAPIAARFAERLAQVAAGRNNAPGRPVVLYYSCVHVDAFASHSFWQAHTFGHEYHYLYAGALIVPRVNAYPNRYSEDNTTCSSESSSRLWTAARDQRKDSSGNHK